jgi:antitoxin component YwqK of YwqJK toxin-antitoxin module
MTKPTMRKTARKHRRRGGSEERHVLYHKDGSIWAQGQTIEGKLAGYWEWFRKDGTRLRSGHFAEGEKTGEWTTYDKAGAVYKVTAMKSKRKKTEASGS